MRINSVRAPLHEPLEWKDYIVDLDRDHHHNLAAKGIALFSQQRQLWPLQHVRAAGQHARRY